MADIAHTSRVDNDESESERPDRELDQLLGELRVAMPGVQVRKFGKDRRDTT